MRLGTGSARRSSGMCGAASRGWEWVVDSLVERSAVSATPGRSATVPMERLWIGAGPYGGARSDLRHRVRPRRHQDVASPTDVQESWDEHGQLPGFAVGS